MAILSHEAAFKAVQSLVASWSVADYVHHISMLKDRVTAIDFAVVFSKPRADCPIPTTCSVLVTLTQPGDGSPEASLEYVVETQQQSHAAAEKLRVAWLDAIVRRKQLAVDVTVGFQRHGALPEPRAFVPGEYMTAAVMERADAGADAAAERLIDAVEDVARTGLAQMAADGSPDDLAALLRQIFVDADADGNGWLDAAEFRKVMQTADLDLAVEDVSQLLMQADANDDGRIEYDEFMPLALEVVEALRLREMHRKETALLESAAEVAARDTLHGLNRAEMHTLLVDAFTKFDANGDGTLSRDEFKTCLDELTLKATKLTRREKNAIMLAVDADGSGTIEYTEFAPLMFDQLVAALSLTFLSHEATELEAYLADHFAAYDAEQKGLLSRVDLKLALTDTDVLALSLHQVHAVLAEAPVEPSGLVEWAAFVPEAARLILKLKDPALEYKRTVMLARQSLPPLDTLTDTEGARLRSDLEGALASAPDGVLPALDAAAALAAAGLELSEREIVYLVGAVADGDGNVAASALGLQAAALLKELAVEAEVARRLEAERSGAKEGQGRHPAIATIHALLDRPLKMRLWHAALVEGGGGEPLAMAAIADAVEAAAEGWALEAAGAAELAAILRADEAPPPAGWAEVAAALRRALRTLGAVNAAFIFVKPHAHTEGVKAMVKEKLGARGVTIVEEGTLDAEAIDSGKLIDQHYYAIASKATLLKPEKLPVPAMEFEKFFGRAWREALKDGRVFNALEACAKLEVDVAGLDALWRAAEAAGKLVKFGGGFYCAKLEPKGKQFAYVFNGFFMAMRAKYVAPGSAISYYSVEWDPAELSWADFRALVLGPTDPAQAPPASIRGAILAEWEALGLAAAPNVGDNGVHASASPFEGMAERMNWLGAKLDSDAFGAALLHAGVRKEWVQAGTLDPRVPLEGGTKAAKGSLFDALEDLDASECIAKASELAKLA